MALTRLATRGDLSMPIRLTPMGVWGDTQLPQPPTDRHACRDRSISFLRSR
jgi:hypothetical protein